jgi:hypothetical protein
MFLVRTVATILAEAQAPSQAEARRQEFLIQVPCQEEAFPPLPEEAWLKDPPLV